MRINSKNALQKYLWTKLTHNSSINKNNFIFHTHELNKAIFTDLHLHSQSFSSIFHIFLASLCIHRRFWYFMHLDRRQLIDAFWTEYSLIYLTIEIWGIFKFNNDKKLMLIPEITSIQWKFYLMDGNLHGCVSTFF